eukprot:6176926-Pleurochrysis_carterae.AAC.2
MDERRAESWEDREKIVGANEGEAFQNGPGAGSAEGKGESRKIQKEYKKPTREKGEWAERTK